MVTRAKLLLLGAVIAIVVIVIVVVTVTVITVNRSSSSSTVGKKVTFPSKNELGDGQGVLIGDPKTTPRGLIVIHEVWGMNEQIQEQGAQIAKEGGFTVLVPDMYRKVAKDREEARHYRSRLAFDAAAQDISAGAKYLISLGCRKVGVMGFCMGGALSFAAAVLSQNISAAAPFYGIPNNTQSDLLKIRIPVQSHFGELDTAVGFSSPADYNALNKSLADAGVPHEMHTYPAGHGFTNVNNQNYNPEATKLAMSRVYEFMRLHLAEGEKVTFPSENSLGDGQGVLIGDPKTTPRGLIVIHEIWGLNEQIREQGSQIAKEGGFTVLVPDMYRGKVTKDIGEARHFMSGLDWNGATEDISAGAKYLISLGCRKVGVMGFCMGGALSFAAAVLSQNISAAAPFYGIPNKTVADLLEIRIPVQSHFGELDTSVGFSSPADYNALNESLANAGVPHEMYTYHAGHAFTNVNNQNYNPEATKLALSRVYEFMRLHLTEGEKVTFPSENVLGDGQGVLIGDPKTTPRGLIVIHEIWGLNEQIQEQGAQIAKEGGFTVLVPDMYRGKVTKNIGEARHFMSGLDWNGATEDISAGAKYLISLGCRKVGVMGFCMGGALSFAAAVLSQNISAAAPFYGIPNKTIADLLQIRIPVQSHFGELDTSVGFSSPADYNALNESLVNAGVPHEMYTYNAGHAFTNVNNQNYNPEATKLAFSRVYELMREHL